MSYLIENEQIKNMFKDHFALLNILDCDTQTLKWKKPYTRAYQIDYVFHKNMLFVFGDMGEAVFNCTWNPKWDTDEGWMIGLSYFAEKLTAIRNDKYQWSSEDAICDLKEGFREFFDNLKHEEFEEMHQFIVDKQNGSYYGCISDMDDLENEEIPYKEIVSKDVLLQYCIVMRHAIESSNESEFAYTIQGDSEFHDFNDFWEWGYECGMRLNPNIECYLAGLQMAYKQLKEEGNI